jgi:hypothetical protein
MHLSQIRSEFNMRHISPFLRATIVLLAAITSTTALAQSGELRIDWATTDAGGATSTGDIYSISGTIAQIDADPLQPASGGNFELTGGFWPGIASAVSLPDPIFSNGFEGP